MHTTRNNDRIDFYLEKLSLVTSMCSPEIQEAAMSLISAVNYRDKTLVHSSFNSIYEALQSAITKLVQQQLGYLNCFREVWRQILEEAKQGLIEDYDALGSAFQERLDEALKNMASLQDGCIREIRDAGYPTELEADLERAMKELKALKEKIFQEWPWANRPLPPVNRRMIEESRRAFARGEGENVNDLIRRLESDPTS